MYTDADKHLKDFNALNQYQQEDEDIWGKNWNRILMKKPTKKKSS